MPVSVLLVAAAIAGCTESSGSDEDGRTGEPASVADGTVPVPPSRLTPFCQEMIDLADRLETDPPDDVEAEIIDTYESIDDEVPDVLRADFDVVLAELRGEPVVTVIATDPPTTTDPPTPTAVTIAPPATDETGATLPVGDDSFDEGRLPGETPAERINAYVDFECRASQNNPGPPPTEPLDITPSTEPSN